MIGMRKPIRAFHIVLMRKRWWTAAACLCLAAVMFCVVNYYPAAVGASASVRQLPIYCVQRDQKLISISFDAAWGNEDTQQLIDILDRYGVKATFFVVGSWVDKYPESVKALSDAGHEVMNHSNTHAHYPQLTADEVIADLNACNDKIEAVTGVRPTLVRMPYGDYDDKSVHPADEITQRVTSKVGPGSIVLFHNAALHTPEALPSILEQLTQEGYTFVPISQLILTGNYSIDHTGRQCPC